MSQGAVAVSNDAPHHAAHVLHQNGKCGNEPKSTTIYHGPFQHHYDAELLRPRHIPFRTEEMDRLEAKTEIKVVNTEKTEAAA